MFGKRLGQGLLLWLVSNFPSLPFLMMVGVAPPNTHRPWVRSTTTSFGARVFSVSYKLVTLVSPSVPSVDAGKSASRPLPVIPMPQVLGSLLPFGRPPSLLIRVFVPKAAPYETSAMRLAKHTTVSFTPAMSATPIAFAFFYIPGTAAAASSGI